MSTVIHVGGRFVAPGDAVVSLLDRGYLLGDGVFATLRGYRGACFRAGRHLAALARGAALFGIDLPAAPPELAALADEAARRTGARDAYVRVTLTRGAPDAAPTLSIVARAMDVPSDDAFDRGIAAVTVTPRRIPPACMDGSVKTTSYAVQLLARREVEARGAAEGIQLAIDGALASGTAANLFVVCGDTLVTPSLESGCRAGITREAVLEIAPRLFRRVREERLAPSVLDDADEAFFTSTRVECLPIASVDGKPVGRGRFDRTHALREALLALVRAELAP
ncbi:MAG: aminotransferase class IV family protein [Labilithrix sp.]|nr:aminotransferase class IV family protein [Labilithrix sp.]